MMIVYFGFTGIILIYDTCSYNCFDKTNNRKYESLKVHSIYNVLIFPIIEYLPITINQLLWTI